MLFAMLHGIQLFNEDFNEDSLKSQWEKWMKNKKLKEPAPLKKGADTFALHITVWTDSVRFVNESFRPVCLWTDSKNDSSTFLVQSP